MYENKAASSAPNLAQFSLQDYVYIKILGPRHDQNRAMKRMRSNLPVPHQAYWDPSGIV